MLESLHSCFWPILPPFFPPPTRSADKQRRLATINASKAATALQLKASLSSQLSACRKERDSACKERDEALLLVGDLKAQAAAFAKEVEVLRGQKEEMESLATALHREAADRKAAEAERGALAERERMLATMLAELGHVASQYLPSLLGGSSQPSASHVSQELTERRE